jgi:CRP/FNR family transcriptional regulator, cyclic AMP receptor protein
MTNVASEIGLVTTPSPYGHWAGVPHSIVTDLFGSAKSRRLKASETLFEAGDAGNGFYLLREGLLKVILTSPDDGDVTIALLIPGTVVGDLAMIDGRPRAASVAALLDCKLDFVSQVTFDNYAEEHPELYRWLATMLAARLREANETIASHALLPVKGRVARALLEIAAILGTSLNTDSVLVPDTISQKDLAAMAGVARETVNRILHEWETAEVVVRSGHSHLIRDKARLEREVASQ